MVKQTTKTLFLRFSKKYQTLCLIIIVNKYICVLIVYFKVKKLYILSKILNHNNNSWKQLIHENYNQFCGKFLVQFLFVLVGILII